MTAILIGCCQITWPHGTPEEQILSEISQAGYIGALAFPHPTRSVDETQALYARYGLKAAPGYFGADFWQKELQDEILAKADEWGNFMHAVGCTELYVSAGGFEGYTGKRGLHRKAVAGRVKPEDGLSDSEFQQLADTLNRVGEITLTYGVRICYHNHVGSVIESGDEIDRLLAMVDPQLVFLGPDTGHLAWAGVDVIDFTRRYASQILTLHVKDINPKVLVHGVSNEWDYDTFANNGIFAELGEGCVDFPAMFDILFAAGFAQQSAPAWLIVETDVTQKPTALDSIMTNIEYLREIGITST
jgi:inosose dehydratase